MVALAQRVAHHDQVHVVAGEAERGEQLHLGQRIILAVAAAAAQRLGGARPAVGLAVQPRVVGEGDAVVDPGIDLAEQGLAIVDAKRRELGRPVVEPGHGVGPLPLAVERGLGDGQRHRSEDVGRVGGCRGRRRRARGAQDDAGRRRQGARGDRALGEQDLLHAAAAAEDRRSHRDVSGRQRPARRRRRRRAGRGRGISGLGVSRSRAGQGGGREAQQDG